jgi:drug/metabolite transporter (DMT)-like permease
LVFFGFKAFTLKKEQFPKFLLLALSVFLLPHSLIAIALRMGNINEMDVSIIEGGIVGVVLAYLFFKTRILSPWIIVPSSIVILVLGAYLMLDSKLLTIGGISLVASSLLTGAGLIIAEKMTSSSSSEEAKEDNAPKPKYFDLIESTKKTIVVSFLSLAVGSVMALTLWALQIPGVASPTGMQFTIIPTWADVVSSFPLAIVGSIMTWFCLFLLIQWEKLDLAALSIGLMPIATQFITYVSRVFSSELGINVSPLHWCIVSILLIGLTALIYISKSQRTKLNQTVLASQFQGKGNLSQGE